MVHLLLDVLQDVLDGVLLLADLPRFEDALRNVKQARLIAFLRLKLQEVGERENETQFDSLLALKLTLEQGLVLARCIVVVSIRRHQIRLILVLHLLSTSDIIFIDFKEDAANFVLISTLLLKNTHAGQMLYEYFEIHFVSRYDL